jgi:myo-inositol 2-dehydrogenase/D-chiro-inositol 1-dehydrogenase
MYTAAGVMVDPATPSGDVDTAVITLRFENSTIGTIDNSRQAVYGYDQRVEVFGSGGMVSADNNLQDRHIYSTADGIYSAKPLYFFLERYMDSFITEMKEFVQSIQEDKTPPVTGIDGRIPVVIGGCQKILLDIDLSY